MPATFFYISFLFQYYGIKDGTPATEIEKTLYSIKSTAAVQLRVYSDVTDKRFVFSYSVDGSGFCVAGKPFFIKSGATEVSSAYQA